MPIHKARNAWRSRVQLTSPYSERNYRWSDDEGEPREKPPHANFKWADCKAAPEGWDDDFDAGQHKMAVFDGSSYHANLWTRFDHVCGEHAERPTPPIEQRAEASESCGDQLKQSVADAAAKAEE